MIAGCADNGALMGRAQLVETGGERPTLVDEGLLYEFDRKQKVHRFVGMVANAVALDVGQDAAESAALARLTQTVYQEARGELTRGVSGSEREEVGRFINRSFSSVAEDVPLSGAVARRSYWKRYAQEEFGELREYYTVWVIVELAERDFNRAKAQVLTEAAQRARAQHDREAEAAARRALDRLTGDGQ